MNMDSNIKLNDLENFDCFDDVEVLRTEKLIEEREIYENQFFSMENTVQSELDYSIAQYEKEIEKQEILTSEFLDCIDALFNPFEYEPEEEPDYEYDEYEEEMFWHLHYLRESQFSSQSKCGCEYLDYIPHDDGLCDYMNCYDYPEGPDENLCGVKYY